MKRVRIILIAFVSAILVSCGTTSTVPITGRKQTLMVSDGEVLSLANQHHGAGSGSPGDGRRPDEG